VGLIIFAIVFVVSIIAIMYNGLNRAFDRITKMSIRLEEFESIVKLASDGMQITHDQVTVTYRCDSTLSEPFYIFDFEKRFNITSEDRPNRYKAQFYANRPLTDKNLTKDFYNKEENKIEWNDLHVSASLRYKRQDEENYTPTRELQVINILASGHYMPFNIIFKTKQGNKIVIKKGMDIILKYSYRVKSRLWGTYLNRTCGLFSVNPIVILKYSSKFEKKLRYNVSKLNHFTGIPDDYRDYYPDDDGNEGTDKKITLDIKSEPFGKYRVNWYAKECFNLEIEDSPIGADELGVTCR
jgi:hypothetical protein